MKIKNVLFVAALAALATLTSCGGSKKGGLPNFGDDEFAVVTIGTTSAALQTTYPATIKGIQDVEVRPKVSGFITKVFVHEGQTVSAGQPLFSIDSETYQAAVRSAAAAVNTAKAQANTAKLTYENNKKLFDSKIIGQYELSTATNSYATAKAQVAQTEAALASAREQLAWCTVTSPSAGVVGSLPFKVGALVSASGQALTTVSNISSQVQDKIFVYIVTKDNKVKYTEIKVNPQDDGKNYIVTSGLNVGDRIVLKGITKLTDGQQIKPITLERYNQKIAEAAKLSESQDNAHAFATAMGGKK